MSSLSSPPLSHLQGATLPLLESSLEWEPLPLQFEQLQNHALDFPLFLESPKLGSGFKEMSFRNTEGFPFFSAGVGMHAMMKVEENSGTPDSFFDDFPIDMFDFLEQPALPTSSSAW